TREATHTNAAPPLDTEIVQALAALPSWVGATLELEKLDEARTMFDALPSVAEQSETVESIDHVVPDSGGVRVVVHRPRSGKGPRPCVYWIHGGGLVLGNHRSEDGTLQQWCNAFDCIATSVEYRLAPEHPYPAPLDDCYAGLAWVHA